MKFQKLQEEVAKRGLTLAKIAVLEAVMDDPRKVSELAEIAQHSTPAATGLTDNLVEQGLAAKALSPLDRRVWIVSPTMQGREVFAEILAALTEEVES